MKLDEAIKHCKEKEKEMATMGCFSCAEDHKQLAEWLQELKAYRAGLPIIEIDGKKYRAENPILKTVHKWGEVVIAGFKEVKNV